MPPLPSFLLALSRAIPGLSAARALGEGLLVRGFAVALCADRRAVALKLTAQALAPEVVRTVQQQASLPAAAVRVDVLV